MRAYTLSTEDVAKTLYELNKNYEGQQVWREAFVNTELAEQQALESVKYDYAKAANQAYAASMANENALLNSNLGQGYKQQMSERNALDLQSAFEQYKQNYLKNTGDITSSYDEVRSGILSSLHAQAEPMSKIINLIPEYYSAMYEQEPGLLDDAVWSKYVDSSTGQLKSFGDVFATGNGLVTGDAVNGYELTPAGIKAYAELLTKNSGYTFGNFLTDNKFTELYDYLLDGDNYNFLLSDVLGADMSNLTAKDENNNVIVQSINDGNKDFSVTDTDLEYSKEWLSGDSGTYEHIADRLKEGRYSVDTSKSWTPDKFVNIDGGSAVVDKFREAAKAGKIKNGTIVDIDPGAGTNFYTYKDGKIYKLKQITSINDAHDSVAAQTVKDIFGKVPNDLGGKNIKLGKTVDTTSDTFTNLDFGRYFGSGDVNGEQNSYINDIINNITENDVGKIIVTNAGRGSSQGLYVYEGNGRFVAIDNAAVHLPNILDKLYLPDGWYIDKGTYTIRGEKWRPKTSADITIGRRKVIDKQKAKEYATKIADAFKTNK